MKNELRITRGARRTTLCALAAALALAACGKPQGVVITPEPSAMCAMRVAGAQVQDAQGRPLALHGASLPALKDLPSPDKTLQELSQHGAKIARLNITDSEILPTFVPGQVQPFVTQANRLGMVAVLSRVNNPSAKPDDQADDAEDWMRLALSYLKNAPGVWLEPFTQPIAGAGPKRQRAIAQRMVDVVRGLGVDDIVLISNADWLLDPDPAINAPLQGKNVVYGLADAAAAQKVFARGLPVFVMELAAPPAQLPSAGSFAAIGVSPAAFESVWKTSASCGP